MTIRLSQHSAPSAEPVSLSEAKVHLRLATDLASASVYANEDDLLGGIISAARVAAETETWKAIVLQAFDLYLDQWPCIDEIDLPMPPLRRVDFVRYTDVDGEVREFDKYTVDTDSTYGRIVLNSGESWPSDQLRPNNPIHIRFWAGALVPFSANATTNTIAAPNHPFSDGDMVRVSVSGGSLPDGLQGLTDYFVINSTPSSLQLSLEDGGDPVSFTDNGSGLLFLGSRPYSTIVGMLLVVTDLYENREDVSPASMRKHPRAASHWFSMDSAKGL